LLGDRAGYEFWLFPNMLSDQVDVVGAFKPALSFQKPADGQSHMATRVTGVLAGGVMIYMLYVYTPDEKTLKANLQKANTSILDMIHSVNTPSIGAGDSGNYQPPPQFGADRTIDIDKIRQRIFQEKIKQREEKARQKAEEAKRAAEGQSEDGSAAASDEGTTGAQGTDDNERAEQGGEPSDAPTDASSGESTAERVSSEV
jgi:hypothetical protein